MILPFHPLIKNHTPLIFFTTSVNLKAALCRSRAVFSACISVDIMYNKDVTNQSAVALTNDIIQRKTSEITPGPFLFTVFLLPIIPCWDSVPECSSTDFVDRRHADRMRTNTAMLCCHYSLTGSDSDNQLLLTV